LTAIGDTGKQVDWLMYGVDVKTGKEEFKVINLGQHKEIKDLRRVWPHEALDFTPCLAEEENLVLLSDAVGLEITVDETESSVGDKSTISRHIKNVFEDGELVRNSVVANFATTASDGKTYQVDYYNLDVIISKV